MARDLFPADLLVTASLAAAANAPYTWWTARTGGTQITNILAADGVSAGATQATAAGVRPATYGPDGVRLMWCDAGAGYRQLVAGSNFLASALVSGDVVPTSDTSRVRVSDYTDGSGTNSQNRANLQAAVNAAVSGKVPLEFKGGSQIMVDDTIDMRGQGLIVAGNDAFVGMTGTNRPIFLMGGIRQRIAGLVGAYNATPPSTDTGSSGVLFYNANYCEYSHLWMQRTAFGFRLAQAAGYPSGETTNTFFSSTLRNSIVTGYSNTGLELVSYPIGGSSSTGNVFDNLYIHNNYSGTPVTSSGPAISVREQEESHWRQINVEWSLPSGDAIFLQSVRNGRWDSIHFEGITLSDSNASLMHLYDDTRISIGSISALTTTLTNVAGAQRQVIRLDQPGTNAASVDVSSMRVRNTQNPGTRNWAAFNLGSGSTAQAWLRGVDTGDLVGTAAIASGAQLKQFNS